MAGADNFAVEKGRSERAVEWMNEFAKNNSQKFEAKIAGYTMQTIKFGSFDIISWTGEWSAARSIIRKASSKNRAKVIESGYHEKRDLLSSMFGGAEFGKVYSNGKLVGQIGMDKKSGKWIARSENLI